MKVDEQLSRRRRRCWFWFWLLCVLDLEKIQKPKHLELSLSINRTSLYHVINNQLYSENETGRQINTADDY